MQLHTEGDDSLFLQLGQSPFGAQPSVASTALGPTSQLEVSEQPAQLA